MIPLHLLPPLPQPLAGAITLASNGAGPIGTLFKLLARKPVPVPPPPVKGRNAHNS